MRGEGLWLAVAAASERFGGIRTLGKADGPANSPRFPVVTFTDIPLVIKLCLVFGRSKVDFGDGIRTVFFHS